MPPANLALLRGINVGGKNKLPMKDLVAIFAAEGCRNVQHYIQSGNVLFDAPKAALKDLSGRIASRILETHGLKTPVVLRTGAQLRKVAYANPFLKVCETTDNLHVMFLAHQPHPTAVLHLNPNRSPPDEFEVIGKEIYMNLPNGVGRSKLTNAYFDTQLDTVSTSRNWRTVLTLLQMMGLEVAVREFDEDDDDDFGDE
jgi:uncharacterized protein (DUF1697 family)